VSREEKHGAFYFTEATVTGNSLLDMLEKWLLPQLNNYNDYIPLVYFYGLAEIYEKFKETTYFVLQFLYLDELTKLVAAND
jgi:hypothetical protein